MFFAYNASALGAGGVIERGQYVYTIPSLASVALAPTGGEGRSVVSNYISQELSVAHAETRVYGRQFGDPKDPSFTTSTYVLLKRVSIFGRVTVGEMGSIVTSTRGFNGGDDHDFELQIWYDDVRIDGKKITLRIDARLRELKRYDELPQLLEERTAAGGDGPSRAERFNGTPDEIVKLVKERKPVQGSVLEGLFVEAEGEVTARPKLAPPVYPVRGLGVVRFGELMLKPGRRRLNLVRMDFGREQVDFEMPKALMMAAARDDSPDSGSGVTGGSMTLGSGEGNGTPVEP